ncbi:hypothetical protein TSTA_052220 [Talaromyces stipitatus ATCC 10500]|uniref:Uncharacterized protein n=1 Tax=Talaromyces stipitatus (strain ATCC 10500 / CBS 375.48 / QM 6759 / NRRL 1006) TaxID=441959 RepID=B8MPR3_TALSN|nr:uncharacterized protein TSTA_052220 [Talaromyces stipitatus ATCC 10500]EED12698.1 hypothetical protein TSTA_052220 [Talaromyces stipitatus ATCC 10500]
MGFMHETRTFGYKHRIHTEDFGIDDSGILAGHYSSHTAAFAADSANEHPGATPHTIPNASIDISNFSPSRSPKSSPNTRPNGNLASTSSAANGNSDTESNIQHNSRSKDSTSSVQSSNGSSLTNLTEDDEVVPPNPKRPCHRRQIPSNELFCDQNEGTTRDANRDDNRIGPTPDSAACDGDGVPMSQNSPLTEHPYEEIHITAQTAQQVNSEKSPTPQVDSRELLNDLSVGSLYQVHQVNSSDLLDDISARNTYSAPRVDSRELLDDLDVGLYQVQQASSSDISARNTYSAPRVDSRELLDDLDVGLYQVQQASSSDISARNTYSAPQVDSRELLDDLSVGLYQVQQVDSDELLGDIRRARAIDIDIDDILREADNFTKSCEKSSYPFTIPATHVS